MKVEKNIVFEPTYKDGRIFVSPIIGCTGGCSYCYLKLQDIKKPSTISIDMNSIVNNNQFIPGKNGTIISIGAWGDIFQTDESKDYSIKLINCLTTLGNPIQFMSKYSLDEKSISSISQSIQYSHQLLYSTTITTIDHWRKIEPHTDPPFKRLETCKCFSKNGVDCNVMIKPFLPGITDLEINKIAELLGKYNVGYCVIGRLYINNEIQKHLEKIGINYNIGSAISTLDCNGETGINSTDIQSLKKYLSCFEEYGIKAFLKSSCVNANLCHTNNPSGYFMNKNQYCIHCGNCI